VEPDAFRGIMARYATGVAVVTVHADGRDHGLTVNSLVSVSLAPPSILVSIGHGSDGLALIEHARAYVVNILTARQEDLARRFAAHPLPQDAFAGLNLTRGRSGAYILADALAWLEAEVVATVPIFDHTLFVGQVHQGGATSGEGALIYHLSRYSSLPSPSGQMRSTT
jgi:flavin reductase (DIM6/NTAB) family NADH-FMN oxidoreductase RutF